MANQILPAALLDTKVEGHNLNPGRLRDQWGLLPTLIVFLRHLGCIFCRDTMAELKRIRDQYADFPEILYVHPSQVAHGESFFAQEDPSARAIADPEHVISKGFGVRRARLGQVLGPQALVCGIQAFRKGHRQTGVSGDPWLMPGYFLVKGDQILWSLTPKHIGELPDFESIRQIAIAERHRVQL